MLVLRKEELLISDQQAPFIALAAIEGVHCEFDKDYVTVGSVVVYFNGVGEYDGYLAWDFNATWEIPSIMEALNLARMLCTVGEPVRMLTCDCGRDDCLLCNSKEEAVLI